MTPKRTPTQHRHAVEMMETLESVQMEIAFIRRGRNIVPSGWEQTERDTPCQGPKKKMTIRLDEEVLDWYRSLGMGYQNRMNAVLKTYMHAILSKHLGDEGDNMNMWMNLPEG